MKRNTLVLGLLMATFSVVLSAQTQYYQALLNSNPNCIEIQGESYISWGSIDNNFITLEQLNHNQDGYINFHFEHLSTTDEIHLRLESSNNDSIYYQFRFAAERWHLEDHQGTNMVLPTSTERTQNVFRLERCGGQIFWYEQGNKPLFSVASVSHPLVAVVETVTATDVRLHLTFETGTSQCDQCATIGGTNLYPGDLMFSAYDNTFNDPLGLDASLLEQDLIQIRNQVALQPGTSFILTEGTYETNSEHWYAGDGRADASMASHKITYTGTNSIPAHSTICFNLSHGLTGNALLASNFYVNSVYNNDFCVKNVGNTANSEINLNSTQAAALFLMQGDWKYQSDHALFCGRVLSGLQYGGTWRTGTGNLPSASRRSQIPPDISCIYIQGKTIPSDTYAQYNENQINNNYTTILSHLINFTTNWTENNLGEDLACTNNEALITDHPKQKLTVYPNPYCTAFLVEFDCLEKSPVTLEIWDMNGRLLQRPIAHQLLAKGTHQLEVHVPTSTQNMQLVRLISSKQVVVQKVVSSCNTNENKVFSSFKK